jgi:hypothetical protein
MKMFRAKIMAAVLMGACVAPLAYSQTAPKDVLPPTSIAHPPVSPTLNVTTPDNVAVPSTMPTAITPLVPSAPVQTIPQVSIPGVVETNKLEAPVNGEAVGPAAKTSSLWAQTNAAPKSAWGKTTAAGNTSPSAAKPAPDLWSAAPANAHLWNSGTQLGSSGTKTDWK